jgi:hypothetical protein
LKFFDLAPNSTYWKMCFNFYATLKMDFENRKMWMNFFNISRTLASRCIWDSLNQSWCQISSIICNMKSWNHDRQIMSQLLMASVDNMQVSIFHEYQSFVKHSSHTWTSILEMFFNFSTNYIVAMNNPDLNALKMNTRKSSLRESCL